jgi:tetratricopeptide (TPR) repeat protein
MPWDYWTADGNAKPATEEILRTLEAVLKRAPNHPGALHYYIHAVEASPNPEQGLAAAHRLRFLIPGAGHLVHMPSHIYLRVGNYHEASLCNERAIAADEAYIQRYKVKSAYPPMYFTHNIHFLWYSTSMEGRQADSLRAARKAAAVLTDEDLEHMPDLQGAKAAPLVGLARFGRWDELLREPQPEACHLYVTAMYHYSRGLAFIRKQQLAEVEKEMAALAKVAADKAAAEKVYREDLRRNPENGWSLFGLLQCLRAQGKAEAAELEARFRDAWKYADTTLTASCF